MVVAVVAVLLVSKYNTHHTWLWVLFSPLIKTNICFYLWNVTLVFFSFFLFLSLSHFIFMYFVFLFLFYAVFAQKINISIHLMDKYRCFMYLVDLAVYLYHIIFANCFLFLSFHSIDIFRFYLQMEHIYVPQSKYYIRFGKTNVFNTI